MIPFRAIRSTIVQGLSKHLSLPVIELNGGGDIPKTAFLTYDFEEAIGESTGFPVEFEVGDKIRQVETVPFTVSFFSYADDKATSVENAMKARDWFKTAGYEVLKDTVNVIVANYGSIENRDIKIGLEWERRHGFEIEFRTIDETERDLITIEKANVKGEDEFGG
ncbi:phage neck terminator protein [Brevibacillus brevis]|uniref:phage neck terminator protein n=1 Tax=Brevibacillus brevis TaxID=1393 RepID=UPI001158D0C7|nr:hypothetical protein [Lysinibacillus sp. SDF0063]TQR29394.1 hypothetical protein C7Y45_28770 [Lysinibacillus sp. SDF0063]